MSRVGGVTYYCRYVVLPLSYVSRAALDELRRSAVRNPSLDVSTTVRRWQNESFASLVNTFRHELVHVRQWRRWHVLFWIGYLLLPLPIGLAWCRWRFEREAYLEELYYYRFRRPEGWGFARVYTPERDLDVSHAVSDRDVLLIPRGYHPFGAPAGYDAYYLNVMAGPNRAWHFTVDPDHAWLMDWDPSQPK